MYDPSIGKTIPAAKSSLKGVFSGNSKDKRFELWIEHPKSRYRRLAYVEEIENNEHPRYRLTADGIRFLTVEIPGILAVDAYWENRF